MIKKLFVVTFASLGFIFSAAAADKDAKKSPTREPASLPECADFVKDLVKDLSGKFADSEGSQTVKIKRVRVVGHLPNVGGTTDDIYSASVSTASVSGTVEVYASRGGCILNKIDLQ